VNRPANLRSDETIFINSHSAESRQDRHVELILFWVTILGVLEFYFSKFGRKSVCFHEFLVVNFVIFCSASKNFLQLIECPELSIAILAIWEEIENPSRESIVATIVLV